MEQESAERVDLELARKGAALWTALEAAQYARLVDADPPRSEAERAEVEAFLDAFGRCAEGWEDVPDQSKAVLFATLDARLSALAELGLHVHAGTIRRAFEGGGHAVEMLIAILRIGRNANAVEPVRVPQKLGVDRS